MWGPSWMPDQQGNATRESGYFQCANRNKYSVSVDIASAQGQEIIREIAKTADVVIENYKAGSLAKYGLDYASLSALNPNVVYYSITGFGQDGPHALNENFKVIASPIKLSDTPVEYRNAPPQLGEHTQHILSRLKTADELHALKLQGIIDGEVA